MPTRTRLCEMKAAELLRDADITGPRVGVKSIAESLYLQIVESSISGHSGRAVLVHGTSYVNTSESPAAQRFSIGHEVGQYILHPNDFVFSAHEDPESELCARDRDGELEREAEYFSGVLLGSVDISFQPDESADRV